MMRKLGLLAAILLAVVQPALAQSTYPTSTYRGSTTVGNLPKFDSTTGRMVDSGIGSTTTGSGSVALGTGPTLTDVRGSVSASVSAAGSNQSAATALGSDINVVTTVSSNTGVRLPAAVAGKTVVVMNRAANALKVYPATGGAIDSLAMDAAYSLPPGFVLQLRGASSTQWYADRPAAVILDLSGLTGIDCTGVSDSSTTFALANAAFKRIKVPAGCTLILNNINLASSSYIEGDGPSSVLKLKDSATAHMLQQSNTGSYTELANLRIDGNYSNNGGDTPGSKCSFRLYAGGASATAPTRVVMRNVEFINGGYCDVSTNYSNPAGPVFWSAYNVRHFGGAHGGYAGAFAGAIRGTFNGIVMDFQRTVSGVTEVGRAGYIFTFYNSSDAGRNSITATGIQCYSMGNTSDAAHLGCFESYSGGEDFILTNSFSKNAVGRAFTWKADTSRIIVANVIVDTLTVNTNNPSASAADPAFGMNSGTGVSPNVGRHAILTGVQCYNVAGACLVVTADNDIVTPTAAASRVLVTNFMVDGCGVGKVGLQFTDAVELKISDGKILNCSTPIAGNYLGYSPIGPVTITNVDMDGTAKPSFAAGIKANGLWYARNRQGVAFSAADLALTVTSSAVTAWTDRIVIDTASAPQSIATINGVPDGETVVIKASSASNSLTLATGGNIGISGNIVISDTTTAVTLRSIGGTLYVIGKS